MHKKSVKLNDNCKGAMVTAKRFLLGRNIKMLTQ